jgi:hypothetical protein
MEYSFAMEFHMASDFDRAIVAPLIRIHETVRESLP